MALTKVKKDEVVSEVSELLKSSKMTVITKYQGTTVKALQDLRRQARDRGTIAKVIKNRLVIKALRSSDKYKNLDTDALQGMLLYAFNSEDEVAPAQTIANFAKTNPSLEFIGAITDEGKLLNADEVKELAKLPSKETLVAEIVAMLMSPLNDITNGLSGDIHGLLDGVAAKAA